MDYLKISEMLDSAQLSFHFDGYWVNVDFVHVWAFSSGEIYDYHAHFNYEFHYIRRGKGKVELSGVEYLLAEGSYYITAPGVVHMQVSDIDEPMLEYSLRCCFKPIRTPIDTENRVENNTHSGFASDMEDVLEILKTQTFGVVQDKNYIKHLFESIFQEFHEKRPGYFSEIKNYIIQIVLSSARCFSSTTKKAFELPKKDLSAYRMYLVRSYISDNINKKISSEELAKHLFLSIRQLNRLIQAETQHSLHEFIILQKLELAKDLLGSTNLKLKSIVDRTGFSSESHLINHFRKHFGISPIRYQKSQLPKNKDHSKEQ